MNEHVTHPPEGTDSDTHSRDPARRRFVKSVPTLVGAALFSGSAATLNAAETQPGCSMWNQPTDADFAAIVGKDKAEFLDRVLGVLENEVVPKTMEGVRMGNKLFGAAILNKSDCSKRSSETPRVRTTRRTSSGAPGVPGI